MVTLVYYLETFLKTVLLCGKWYAFCLYISFTCILTMIFIVSNTNRTANGKICFNDFTCQEATEFACEYCKYIFFNVFIFFLSVRIHLL